MPSAKPKRKSNRPSFEKPPVAEVVCGLQFRPLAQFEAPHYGLFWETIRKNYPRSRTIAPIANQQIVEVAPHEPITLQMVANAPELPRVWFISKDDTCLVQLQPDRFLFNWREGDNQAEYPRYDNVIKKFRALYQSFEKFVSQNKIGNVSLMQCELTYINHIKPGDGWQELADMGEVFPDLSWRRGKRYLPPPSSFVFRTNHVMSNGNLQLVALNAKARTDKSLLIRLDIGARATIEQMGDIDQWKWFDLANSWIVNAFIDFTSQKMQRDIWKRTK